METPLPCSTDKLIDNQALNQVNNIKESSFDFRGEMDYDLAVERRLAMETTTLVQPFQLKVGRERFEASEVLFDPDKAGVVGDGLHRLLYNSIMKADIDLRLE
eukprot:336889_1